MIVPNVSKNSKKVLDLGERGSEKGGDTTVGP